VFADIRHNESEVLERWFDGIDDDRLEVTVDTLRSIQTRLRED
jgi:hypothetical protein